jgi:hypothetical protein
LQNASAGDSLPDFQIKGTLTLAVIKRRKVGELAY